MPLHGFHALFSAVQCRRTPTRFVAFPCPCLAVLLFALPFRCLANRPCSKPLHRRTMCCGPMPPPCRSWLFFAFAAPCPAILCPCSSLQLLAMPLLVYSNPCTAFAILFPSSLCLCRSTRLRSLPCLCCSLPVIIALYFTIASHFFVPPRHAAAGQF